jgi:hypothetical protein
MRHVKEDWADATDARVTSSASQLGNSRGTIAALSNHKPGTSQRRYALKLEPIMEVS